MKTPLKKLTAAVLCILLVVGICASSLGELIIKQPSTYDPTKVHEMITNMLDLWNAFRDAHSKEAYEAYIACSEISNNLGKTYAHLSVCDIAEAGCYFEKAKDGFANLMELSTKDRVVRNVIDEFLASDTKGQRRELFDALTRSINVAETGQFDIDDIQIPLLEDVE